MKAWLNSSRDLLSQLSLLLSPDLELYLRTGWPPCSIPVYFKATFLVPSPSKIGPSFTPVHRTWSLDSEPQLEVRAQDHACKVPFCCLPAFSWCLPWVPIAMLPWGLRGLSYPALDFEDGKHQCLCWPLTVMNLRIMLKCLALMAVLPGPHLVPKLMSYSSMCVPPNPTYYFSGFQTAGWPNQLFFSRNWHPTHR